MKWANIFFLDCKYIWMIFLFSFWMGYVNVLQFSYWSRHPSGKIMFKIRVPCKCSWNSTSCTFGSPRGSCEFSKIPMDSINTKKWRSPFLEKNYCIAPNLMGHFWAQNEHLNFSQDLFIRFFWNCTGRKVKLYRKKYEIIPEERN